MPTVYNHGVGHAEVTEHRFATERRDDLADHSEAWKDQDVNFGMPEEPEQMLVQNRVATIIAGEERRSEVAIGQQHRDRASQHRQCQQQQKHRHQNRPHEQRHLVQGHARRAHIEDGCNEVDGAEDRGGTGEMQRQDAEVDGRARVPAGRQRRIECPARPDTIRSRLAFHKRRSEQQGERRRQQPERNVVHAREGHVRRADHQRHKPVTEAADHCRHHHEEDHDQAVRGNKDIELMRRRKNLNAGILQL
jgi:hypothetical protein